MKRLTVFLPIVSLNNNGYLEKTVASFWSQKKVSLDFVCISKMDLDGMSILTNYRCKFPGFLTVLKSTEKDMFETIYEYLKEKESDYFCIVKEGDFLMDELFLSKACEYLEYNNGCNCYFANTAFLENGNVTRIDYELEVESYSINKMDDLLNEMVIVPHSISCVYRTAMLSEQLLELGKNVTGTVDIFLHNFSWYMFALYSGSAYYSADVSGVHIWEKEGIVDEKISQMYTYISMCDLFGNNIEDIYWLNKQLHLNLLSFLNENEMNIDVLDKSVVNRYSLLYSMIEGIEKIILNNKSYDTPIVSFCISTYNRSDMVMELISHLLQYRGKGIEIIVVDNGSTDDTYEALCKVTDERVKIYRNDENCGATRAWYTALQKGNGKYLFQLIDRDWIDIGLLDEFLFVLEKLDRENVAFAVAGELVSTNEKYQLIKSGLQGFVNFALRDTHPTGMIFRKKEWDECKNKDKYFRNEEYGIYPHGYIFAIMAKEYNSAYIGIDICDKKHYEARKQTTVSQFYSSRKKQDYWFLPKSRYGLLINVSNQITDFISEKELIKAVICQRYYRYLWESTWGYKCFCENANNMRRYNCEEMKPSEIDIIENAFTYIVDYKRYLQNRNFDWVDKNFLDSISKIDVEIINELYTLMC